MTTHFLNRPSGSIAYDDAGDGQLVICAPSMGDVRAEYRFLTPLLVAAGYRVVTMDLRGLGESSTEWDDFSVAGVGSDLVELARQLAAGPAVIVGESMAAGAAWQWYYKSLYPTQQPADFEVYTAHLRRNLAEPGRLEALQKMLAASKAASETRLDRVHAPVLVLMGSKDPDFKDPVAEAQFVAERLRGSLHLIEGAGHYPHAEMPAVTVPHVLAFLGALQPAHPVTYGA